MPERSERDQVGHSIAADTAALAVLADQAERDGDIKEAASLRRAAGHLCDAIAVVRGDHLPRTLLAWRDHKAEQCRAKASRLQARAFQLRCEADQYAIGDYDTSCPAYESVLLGLLNKYAKGSPVTEDDSDA